jgi:hypothetical protein
VLCRETAVSAYAPLDRNIGFHPRLSEAETKKREAVLRVAERHFTAAEFSELIAELASDRLSVRIYDDCIVLTRTF